MTMVPTATATVTYPYDDYDDYYEYDCDDDYEPDERDAGGDYYYYDDYEC